MKPLVAHPNPGASIKTVNEQRSNPGDISAQPTLKLFAGTPGVDLLDPNLTINGTTVTPSIRYKGGDADGTDWDAWGYGATLALQAGTAPSYNQGSPGHGGNDDSVKFNAGGYYQAPDADTGQIETEDFVIEVVQKFDSGNGFGTLTSSGWSIGGNALTIDTGPSAAGIFCPASVGSWVHQVFFGNRDENSTSGCYGVTNGVTGSGVNISALSATLAGASFDIGSRGDGASTLLTGNIAYLAMWKLADWIAAGAGGASEVIAIAQERFHKLDGAHPQVARGTAIPTVASRASEAYLDKWEGAEHKLYQVGDNWMRTVNRKDTNGDSITGYLAEPQQENEILYSEDFSDAAWVKTRSAVDANSAVAPDGETTADGLVGGATSNTHFVGQAIASTADEHMFSVWLKAGDKSWAYIDIPTVAQADAYFDLATPAVGTVGANAVAKIEDWGNGWCRCLIVYTGGVPSHSHDIYAADADTDHTFTGDASTVNIYMWGAMHYHAATDIGHTSYIKTEGSIVTRVKDQLRYKGDDGNVNNNGKGSIACSVLLPNINTATTLTLSDISDGGASADHMFSQVSTSDVAVVGTRATAGSDGDSTGTTDLSDDTIHTAAYSYMLNALQLYIDGTQEGSTDTSCDIPDDLDRVDVGQNISAAEQLDGVISNLRFYSKTGVKK